METDCLSTVRMIRKCASGLLAMLMMACSGEESVGPTPETNPKDNGEVEFTIKNDGGSGSGSSSSPAEVSKGDTLNMTISQKSSYTDSDGSVFSCEPKATIELFAKVDTVYVEDRNLLTDVKGNPEVKTSQSGTSPIRNVTAQSFQIGNDQFINFDLAYEIYKYVNKANQTIEMPYVKVNQANLGGSGASEEPTARTETVPKITIKPLVQTRAVVTDTTWYEVNARFNLELESVNTKTDNKQTVEFSVTYIGAVTTKTELLDPVSELSSDVSIESGSSSTSSPFTVNLGEALNLVLKQTSSYTDAYGNKTTCEPAAKINLFAQTDTVFVSNKDELTATPKAGEAVFTPSGENPVLNTATQLFVIGKETVRLDMSYEAYTAEDVEKQKIAMPYLKLNPAAINAATISERATSKGATADTTYYEVKVPLSLEAESVNATTESRQMLEFVVTYLGAVVTQTEEPTLVKMEYRPGWTWEEAHHNLPLLYYAHVDRDRYYSNGEVVTDHFVDNGHPVESICELEPNQFFPGVKYVNNDKSSNDSIIYTELNIIRNDSVFISKHSTIVTDLSKLSYREIVEGYFGPQYGEWGKYVMSKSYSEQDGWFFQSIPYRKFYDIYYKETLAIRIGHQPRFYDQFLSIDGTKVTFLDYQPEHSWNLSVENISESQEYGPGKKIVYECKTKFLGRNFYIAAEETIYQRK